MKTERKKRSVGGTEDLPGVAFLTPAVGKLFSNTHDPKSLTNFCTGIVSHTVVLLLVSFFTCRRPTLGLSRW